MIRNSTWKLNPRHIFPLWYSIIRAFPGDSAVKNPPAMQKLRGHWFDPWVRKMPRRRVWHHTPVILAWRTPWTEEPVRLQSIWSQRVGQDWSDIAHNWFSKSSAVSGVQWSCSVIHIHISITLFFFFFFS